MNTMTNPATKVWMSVAMLQECIDGKRVMVHGLYRERSGEGDAVEVLSVQPGKSTIWVSFAAHSGMPVETWQTLSVKKFHKKFVLVGV